MKTLPKLWKLLSIAILLVGIGGDACFAETQMPTRVPMALVPSRYKCIDLLELERIEGNSQNNTIRTTDTELALDYREVAGWLQGFFTAWNHSKDTDGDITKGTKPYQWMAWIFSYCRTHPSENLPGAAFEFMNAMRKGSTTK